MIPAPTPLPPSTQPGCRLIVGCGYLGSRVAQRWLAEGSSVWAITRKPARAHELAAAGLQPILADVAGPLPPLPRVDTMFWAVGFDRSAAATHRDIHVTGLQRVLDTLPGSPRIVFSSSTGVWGDTAGESVNEQTPAHPTREAGLTLLEAEQMLSRHRLGPGVALRFAGLYGPDRLPRLEDLRAGVPLAADPDSWLNLIHVDDAADVVVRIAAHSAPQPLYGVSDGMPVQRREWYGHLASLTGCPLPSWDVTAPRARGADKRVDSTNVWRDLQATPHYPDAFCGLSAILKRRG